MTQTQAQAAPAAIEIRHTPGPWKSRGGGHNYTPPGEKRDRTDMMDWCSGVDCIAPFAENEHGNFETVDEQAVAKAHGKTLAEAQANARLIAAAPDLLAALKLAYRHLNGGRDSLSPTEHEEAFNLARAAIAAATTGARP